MLGAQVTQSWQEKTAERVLHLLGCASFLCWWQGRSCHKVHHPLGCTPALLFPGSPAPHIHFCPICMTCLSSTQLDLWIKGLFMRHKWTEAPSKKSNLMLVACSSSTKLRVWSAQSWYWGTASLPATMRTNHALSSWGGAQCFPRSHSRSIEISPNKSE